MFLENYLRLVLFCQDQYTIHEFSACWDKYLH